ncbi:MAG: outer membrane lipoprotein carrier protein LolA [Alphaproteobacteria bacterium]|nr:outer membrane lipoprotein carrier protein LolA [Alphaproteobacteria bacterium]
MRNGFWRKLATRFFAAALALQSVPAQSQETASPLPDASQSPVTEDDAAKAVAATVQAFYDQTTSINAHFYQTYVNKLYQRTDRSKGTVAFEKPGKMRWDYGTANNVPNKKVIASDGQRLQVYEPGEEGEQGQIFTRSGIAGQLPRAMSFLTGAGRLEEDFDFRLLDSARNGFPTGHVLEMRSKTPTPEFDRVVLYVESNPALRGLVRRVLIVDHDGNRNRFDFSRLKFNSPNPQTNFSHIAVPKGTRQLEM